MLKLEDLHGAIHGFESLSEAARKAGVSTAHMAHAMKQFRQEYPCDWNEDPDDLVTITDMNGNSLEFVRRRCEPKVKIEFYGYPITIREANPLKNDHIRVDAWAPDQEGRTQPLLSQTFTRSAFYEAITEARANCLQENYGMYPQSGEEAFILAWGKENMREIERNYHKRSTQGINSFTDWGMKESAEEIEKRRLRLEEQDRRREEEAQRKERELLTAIPAWGSF
jgi:hypothetical protein